jgi:hypothetical protein
MADRPNDQDFEPFEFTEGEKEAGLTKEQAKARRRDRGDDSGAFVVSLEPGERVLGVATGELYKKTP